MLHQMSPMTAPRALHTYSRTARRMPGVRLPRIVPGVDFRVRRSLSSNPPPPNPNSSSSSSAGSNNNSSTSSNTSPTPLEAVNRVHALHTSNFAAPTLASLNYFRRALAYALTGLAGLALTTALAFEGAHQWVELVELAPHPSSSSGGKEDEREEERWGWSQADERWTGAWEEGRGGTDPALGWKARHAVRGAWIALHWGVGSGFSSSDSTGTRTGATAIRNAKPGGGVEAVDARLELAHDFLGVALRLALKKQFQDGANGKGGLRERTIPELLLRHADVLERMGGRAYLLDARAEYERVWASSSVSMMTKREGRGRDDAARLAAKLGDVNARLGERDEAMGWWGRVVALLGSSPSSPSSPKTSPPAPTEVPVAPFELPTTLPSSPLSQRTLATLIPSLSAHFVGVGDLQAARRVQEAGLNLLSHRNINGAQPERNRTSKSPAETLHELYLAHRASLVLIHLAEVTYALSSQTDKKTKAKKMQEDVQLQPLDRLRDAALSSERIANVLTGVSPSFPSPEPKSAQHDPILLLPPPTPDKSLSAPYSSSHTLKQPASSLLRDARRAAVEAWTLAGILCESESSPPSSSSSHSSLFSSSPPSKPNSESNSSPASSALECYTRALAWAGVGSDSEGGRAGEGTLEREWDALWRRYVRVREVVRAERREGQQQAAPTSTNRTS
ncbi:hypothetical protein SCHPADRAFT_866096 [Schizopora paradoxa]|uniref:Uncharacterized protein n=1 Tax=Schizopora paradoxa TaxID=27342 RepID=A0A0H2S3H3_9AGAM|nr:hypothetical protein SCHPADRAFT_866096 [Schizopora paradoxa]